MTAGEAVDHIHLFPCINLGGALLAPVWCFVIYIKYIFKFVLSCRIIIQIKYIHSIIIFVKYLLLLANNIGM